MTQKTDNVVDLSGLRHETRKQVLERLFTEHGAALRDFLRARTGLTEDLDDIVQEVFVKLANLTDLHEKAALQSGSTRAYLFTAANNLVLDRQRRQVLQRAYHIEQGRGDSHITLEVTPERIIEGIQDLAVVKRTILKLPPKCRKVFLLHRFENWSYRQIAREMGLSVKQIEKYMSQALVSIREASRRARR